MNPKLRAQQRRNSKQYRMKHPSRTAEQRRRYLATLRNGILQQLGNKCVKCGYTDSRALQIDHIWGQGTQDRKRVGGTWGAYRRMARMSDADLRSNFQCLCANCNWIKRYERREN